MVVFVVDPTYVILLCAVAQRNGGPTWNPTTSEPRLGHRTQWPCVNQLVISPFENMQSKTNAAFLDIKLKCSTVSFIREAHSQRNMFFKEMNLLCNLWDLTGTIESKPHQHSQQVLELLPFSPSAVIIGRFEIFKTTHWLFLDKVCCINSLKFCL